MSRFFEEIARAYLVLKGVPFPFYFDLIVYLQGPPDISINTILTIILHQVELYLYSHFYIFPDSEFRQGELGR